MDYRIPEFDDRDAELLAARKLARATFDGPRVGDYYVMPDGELRRFSHQWNDGLQVTWKGESGSFHLCREGFVSYSGGLEPTVKTASIIFTGEERDGVFWFFHHDEMRAHNGVTVYAPCRVYRHPEAGSRKVEAALSRIDTGRTKTGRENR